MPIDLADIDPRIIVTDPLGTEVPFSRGVMATSLLATGVLTDEAYRLASLIQARLLHHDRHDVTISELVELTRITLDEHAPEPAVAQRWSAWQRAKQTHRPTERPTRAHHAADSHRLDWADRSAARDNGFYA